MKKFIICFIALFMAFGLNAQTFKTINKDFSVTKPVKMITDEKGKVFLAKTDDVFVHLEQLSLTGGENLVEYWIEVDGQKTNYNNVGGRILELTNGDSITYFVENDECQYCMIMFEPYTKTWNVDLRTKKD